MQEKKPDGVHFKHSATCSLMLLEKINRQEPLKQCMKRGTGIKQAWDDRRRHGALEGKAAHPHPNPMSRRRAPSIPVVQERRGVRAHTMIPGLQVGFIPDPLRTSVLGPNHTPPAQGMGISTSPAVSPDVTPSCPCCPCLVRFRPNCSVNTRQCNRDKGKQKPKM